VRYIQLTKGKIAIVDDADYDELNKFNWHYHGGYAKRTIFVSKGKSPKCAFLHHYLLPKKSGFEVDHRDLNTLNNQRDNLRYATKSQQMANRPRFKNGKASKYKGVYAEKSKTVPWCAQIRSNGKIKYLGCFATEEAAALAYNMAAIDRFGEYARLNEINPVATASESSSAPSTPPDAGCGSPLPPE
jgi:hypothetical protein